MVILIIVIAAITEPWIRLWLGSVISRGLASRWGGMQLSCMDFGSTISSDLAGVFYSGQSQQLLLPLSELSLHRAQEFSEDTVDLSCCVLRLEVERLKHGISWFEFKMRIIRDAIKGYIKFPCHSFTRETTA